ncbi:MAG: hypothetical protein EHJ95_00040 [Methanobacteriota archaeon]|nr:MAG: hypothetical protein EHJ95_00305 [Euryarchaeota archaeon]RPJ54490.1 MAG: hypothetical protein EHJ95_00040 [Euryarchaeota archaeon]
MADDIAGMVGTVAQLMALSARTAPKARGIDTIVTDVVAGERLIQLATEMRAYGEAKSIGFIVRDSDNIRISDACLLVGLEYHTTAGLDCGACGHPTCAEMLACQDSALLRGKPYKGPNCVVRATDLGIAIGSAVKTASIHNVDNRVMYSVGVASLRLGWLEGCGVAYGVPLSATAKNIFYDRG